MTMIAQTHKIFFGVDSSILQLNDMMPTLCLFLTHKAQAVLKMVWTVQTIFSLVKLLSFFP